MRAPLGLLAHARSGDKGGDANIGLWIGAEADERDAKVAWLISLITPEEVRELLPEARDLDIEVHPLPNLSGVNVVIHGLLGEGVAASTRFDPQAKGLAEFVRSRFVEVPDGWLAGAKFHRVPGETDATQVKLHMGSASFAGEVRR